VTGEGSRIEQMRAGEKKQPGCSPLSLAAKEVAQHVPNAELIII
jgi:hypothetical protein